MGVAGKHKTTRLMGIKILTYFNCSGSDDKCNINDKLLTVVSLQNRPTRFILCLHLKNERLPLRYL